MALGQKTIAKTDSLHKVHYYPKFREHCVISSVGFAFVETSVITVIPIGIGDMIVGSQPPNKVTGAFAAASIINLSCLAIGGACLYFGHRHEYNHYDRFSLVVKEDQLWIAYNF